VAQGVDYIGFGITILSASYSYLLSGDGLLSLELLVRFAALIVSYLCMPQAHICNPAPGNARSRRDATSADEYQPTFLRVDRG
jgi:hypothetical protein